MSNIVRDINNVIKKHKMKRVYMLIAIILSFAVLFMVVSSLIRPAMSATRLGTNNDGYDNISDAVLLVGNDNDLYTENYTVADVTKKAEEKYALGIASQFSVFLKKDLKVGSADTEGRVAVGGGIDANNYQYEGNYNIGYGHYVNSTSSIPFSQLGYKFTDAAVAIVNGSTFNRITLPNNNDTRKFAFYANGGVNLDSFTGDEKWYMYKYDTPKSLVDFDAAFSMLNQRSSLIALNATKTENTVEVNSDSNIVTFTYKGNEITAESVIFNISKETWSAINKLSGNIKFEFKNIPKLSTQLSGKEVDNSGKINDSYWQNSYIVINVETDENTNIPYQPIYTSVNDKSIGKASTGVNNSFGCNTLLYNFSNAKSLKLGRDFQGTILAPNAAVTDNESTDTGESKCPGHLSGALIAQSFEGYTEFGYRPYTGPIEVLGTSVNYTVNVSKLDGNRKFLSGATLGLYEVSNGTLSENPVQMWTSGDSTKVISLDPDKKYALKEITPPEDYQQTNDIYYFEVTEGEKKTADVTVGQTTGSSSQTTETDLWSGSLDLGSNWSTYVTLSSDKFSTIKSGDKIKVYLSDVQSNAQIQIQDSSWSDIFGIQNVSGNSAEFTVTDDTLSKVQSDVYVKGKNATVSKVTLVTTTSSTEPVDITVETSYVSSVTFKQYSDSSFSTATETIIVHPYNTSDLSKVSYKIDSSDVKGSEVYSQYKQTVGDCTFVVKDGTILTPTVNFKTFEFVNTLIPKGANIVLEKVDNSSYTTLSDSSVSLYSSDNTKIGTYTLGKVTLPDSNTAASYFDSNKLMTGTYYLVEETVPVGYVDSINGEKLGFTVNDDGSVSIGTDDLSQKWLKAETSEGTTTIKILNEQGGNLDIEKKWQNSSGEAITSPENANVTVKLYRTTDTKSANQIKQMSAEGTGTFALTRTNSTGDDSWFTIENILSNYQFFVNGDLTATSHTCGAVVAGGNVILSGGWGKSQVSPSYLGTISGTCNFEDSANKVGDYKNNTVYYGNKAEGGSFLPENCFVQQPDFINIDTAMNKVKEQSNQIVSDSSAYVAKESDITTINGYQVLGLDGINYKNFIIPYDVLKKAKVISINNSELTVKEFVEQEYKISITKVNNNDLTFDYQSYVNNSNSNKSIRLNFSDPNDQSQMLKSENVDNNDKEYYGNGMNFIVNLPDATGNVNIYDSMLCHIVAPSATVSLNGNSEGSVIAGSINYVNNEAHFWPYYAGDETTPCPGTSTSSGSESSSSSSSSESSASSSESSSESSSSTSSSDTSSSTDSSSSGGSGSEVTGDFVMNIILNKDNEWKQTISGLPVEDENGNKYQYYVVEDPVIEGYTPSYSQQPVTLTKGEMAKITITNTQDAYVLPSTGGTGSTVFYISGGALALFGAVMLVLKRRKAF